MVSVRFTVKTGTKQRTYYVTFYLHSYLPDITGHLRDLLNRLVTERIVCIGGQFINVLAYAYDIVLLATSRSTVQQLLDVLCSGVSRIL